MPLTVVIPSKTLANLKECVIGVRESGFTGRILIMDDFDPETSWDFVMREMRAVDPLPNMTNWIRCKRPFVFARNVNAGIDACYPDDVLMLNDDAVVQNRGALEALEAAAAGNETIGAFSALIRGMAAAPDQVWKPERVGTGDYAQPWFPVQHHMIAFMATMIPRRVINRIGKLDERFTGYGYDDDDYCLRLKKANYGLAVVPGCLVEHGSLVSTYRGEGRAAQFDMLAENRAIFNAKWGVRK